MILEPPLWAEDAWVDETWADDSWSTEQLIVYTLDLHNTVTLGLEPDRTTAGLVAVRTSGYLMADRTTESI